MRRLFLIIQDYLWSDPWISIDLHSDGTSPWLIFTLFDLCPDPLIFTLIDLHLDPLIFTLIDLPPDLSIFTHIVCLQNTLFVPWLFNLTLNFKFSPWPDLLILNLMRRCSVIFKVFRVSTMSYSRSQWRSCYSRPGCSCKGTKSINYFRF